MTADLLKKANEYFRQAIEKDPSFALAYGGLAESYALFNFYGVQPPRESCASARAAALKALEIDANQLEARTAQGWIRLTCDWDWQGSQREFKNALDTNPSDAAVRSFYTAYLKAVGRIEESIAEYKRALELEPLSLITNATLGRDLSFMGRDDEGMEQLRKTIDLAPGFVETHLYLGWIYEKKGKFAEAIAEIQQDVSASGGHPRFVSSLGHPYAVSGQRRLAEEMLTRLKDQMKHRYVAPYDIAVVYAGLNETDQTFKYLEMAWEDRSFWMIWLRIDLARDDYGPGTNRAPGSRRTCSGLRATGEA